MSKPDPDPADEDTGYETLADELRALVREAEGMARAELSYQIARATLAGRYAGRLIGLGLLALALVFFALMALVVGLLLALAPGLGPWGAMLAVVLGLVVASAAVVFALRAGWCRLLRLLRDADGET